MEFRILGSFEVAGIDGVVELRGAKRRGLLACLVAHAGQPMSTDRLVEELWGRSGSDGAARTVQTYVSQLRKLLNDRAASLVTGPGGYVLEVDPAHVDASRFERAVTAAAPEPDPANRLAMLDEALELWRGPPLGEFAGASWADRAATRLEALHLQALQRRYDSLLDLGRAEDAAAELEPMVRAHPLDERLWAKLMLALYRSGQQADALGAYRQARRHLINELGIEPGPQLVDLEHRILDHDPTLAAPTIRLVAEHTTPASEIRNGWHPRTFLLTDIVDSVSLWERGPPAMSDAVARHEALIHDAVAASGGELVRTKGEGDSTFSVFLQPSDALTAATAIQETLAAEPWPVATALRVRIGVHTGDAEPRGGDWHGPAVNRAARLRALATGGHTLVSGVTAGLVADRLPKAVRLLYLGRRILRGIERPEEVWELVAAEDPRLSAPTSTRAGGLPVALTRFVGRGADFDQLIRLIEHERLITLTGPGGSGKTRLALEVARRAERRGERVWLAELASLRDSDLVAPRVATAVGIETGPDPLNDLLTQPEALTGLLVLDNCEHLLDPCAALTGELLAAAADLRVLATSREPLGLAGEQVWPVGPLDVPDESLRDREQLTRVESVQLLLDRARAVQPGLEVGDDDVASVVGICRALDGIPLAIELAAVRLRSLSFVDLRTRLGDQLLVLARRRLTGWDDARHRTLRMTLDWSYDLLTEQQQTLAQRLSVFAGGFRLDAVEAVCGGDLDVLDGIDELVAKSLVTFDGVTARYRLLEPLRQYLAERLSSTGETEAVRRSHARWVAAHCKRLGPRLLEDQRARNSRLREEGGNIEAALLWAHDRDEAEIACEIVGALGQFWFFNDQLSSRRWSEITIGLSARAAPHLQARVLLGAGMAAQNDWAWDRSLELLREALAIYQAEQAIRGEAATLYWLGRGLASRWDAERMDQDAAEAGKCFQRGDQLFTGLGDLIGSAWCRIWLSSLAFWEGDLHRAETLAQQVVDECTTAGIDHPISQALCHLAFIAHRQGRDDRALDYMHEAVGFCRQRDDDWQLIAVLADLAAQEVIAGRGTEALRALAESARLDVQIGRLPVRTRWLAVAAVVHHARGDLDLSAAALGAYDVHATTTFERPPGGGIGDGYIGWVTDAVLGIRARLDPTTISAATTAARRKTVDELITDLIVEPASGASAT
jgi:predicted ATPase/DNA-binding SARP family transcriptional activator